MTTTMSDRPPLLVDSREAARLLGISPRTLYTLTRRGDIRAVRPTAWSVRYALTELERYIGARMDAPAA